MPETSDSSTHPSREAAPVSDPKALRLSYLDNIALSFKHIGAAINTEGKRVRGSDYLSILMVPAIAMVMAVFSINKELLPYRPVPVVLFSAALLYFIGARIGILRVLTGRQAHLVFLLMCACFFLGCAVALVVADIVNKLP